MDEPVEQTTYVGWGNVQAAIMAAILTLLLTVGLTALLYLRMGDVADSLQQQAVMCAQK